MSAGDRGIDATLPAADVREMVATLRPGWTVESIDRSPQGTDFVAVLELGGSEVPDRAVLKATTSDLVPEPIARAEPRLLEFVGRETGVPVPAVYGICDAHDEHPAPFYLLEYVAGETYEGPPPDLDPAVRDRIVRDAGKHLAALHELGPLDAYGRIGIPADGGAGTGGVTTGSGTAGDGPATEAELGVIETPDHDRYTDPYEAVRAVFEPALDALESGTWFPERADDPDRFADLVPELRAWVKETVPALPEPDPPTYSHADYRYGNVVVDPETGAIEAVLDWANTTAAEPAYGVATAESLLLTPDRDPEARTAELHETFRSAYLRGRNGWRFTEERRERVEAYRLAKRLDAMACLPLWYEDATPAERDRRAGEHRAFVRAYLDG